MHNLLHTFVVYEVFLQSPTVSVVTVYALNYVCVCFCLCPCVCAFCMHVLCIRALPQSVCSLVWILVTGLSCVQHACCVKIYNSNSKIMGVIAVCHVQS